jgi:hypothetical protein
MAPISSAFGCCFLVNVLMLVNGAAMMMQEVLLEIKLTKRMQLKPKPSKI